MKTSLSTVLAGAGSAMILTTSAHAAYIGLYVEYTDSYFSNHPNIAVRDAWNAGPMNQYDIYRLYAVFNTNTAADRVNAVAGTPGSPLQLTAFVGTFHNYTEDDGHGGTVHFQLPSFFPPERAWD